MSLLEILPIVLSTAAIILSGLTLYFVNFWGGKITMVKPSQIWFGFSKPNQKGAAVFIKTLLYTSGLQGRVVESMYVTLSKGETKQSFNIWNIGQGSNMYRPGGLRVSKSGYLGDHVFLLPKNSQEFQFTDGKYTLEIYAHVAGDNSPLKLQTVKLDIPPSLSNKANNKRGIYFDLHSDAAEYVVSLDEQPSDPNEEMLDIFRKMGESIDQPGPTSEMLEIFKQMVEGSSQKHIEQKK